MRLRANPVQFRRLLSLLAIFGLCLPCRTSCLAQNDESEKRTVPETFEVSSDFPIATAYGILLTPRPPEAETGKGGMIGLGRAARIRGLGDNRWRVEVQLESKDYQEGNKLTIVATTSKGIALPSEVRLLGNSKTTHAITPVCQEQADAKDIAKLLALDDEKLGVLLQVRKDQRSLLERHFRSLLTPTRLERLNALEADYGLSYTQPLWAETELNELAFRIGALDALRKRSDTDTKSADTQ
jgi:hypothetical protein